MAATGGEPSRVPSDRSGPRRLRLVVFAAAVLISAVGAVVWSRSVSSGETEADDEVELDVPGEYVEPGTPTNPPLDADQLPAVTLETAAGDHVELAVDGRPMVINLWYSTCPPCARELADFAAVHDEVGDAVRFVGVNPRDTAATMTRFAADRGVTYELLRDPQYAFADDLGLVAFPVTLFVAADGQVVGRSGAIGRSELRQQVADLLA